MALFDFLRRKESQTGGVIFTGGGQVIWTPRNYGKFALEGYQLNVVAYQSINKIAEAVASVKWQAWQGDQELTTSPFLDLLNRPSPTTSGSEFMQAHISYEMIAGNAYMEKVSLDDGVPKELFTLRPDRMTIKEGRGGIPSAFIYKVGQREFVWEVDEVTGESDIWHFKSFNPLDDWYGMAPTEAVAYAIDQHNEAMRWIQALLQNSARPSGALVFKPKDGTAVLGDDQFNRLKTQMEDQYSGATNAGRPMLLDGGLEWQSMGLSPSDMGIIETKNSAARDIALGYGVPPQLLGIPGDNTYSNYKEARLAFWEDTVLPIVENTADELNVWLGPSFDNTIIKPDLDKIPAIIDKRQDLWEMADKSDDLTIDERRAMKGFDELPNGEGAKLQERVMRQTDKPADDIKKLSPTMKAAFAYGEDYGK